MKTRVPIEDPRQLSFVSLLTYETVPQSDGNVKLFEKRLEKPVSDLSPKEFGAVVGSINHPVSPRTIHDLCDNGYILPTHQVKRGGRIFILASAIALCRDRKDVQLF